MGLFDYKGKAPERGSLVLRALKSWLPMDRRGDALFALGKFRKRNGRWPVKEGGDLNDFLYYLRISKDMDDPLRSRVTCKLGVRDYFREKLGEDRSVPLWAVLETREAILGHSYPSRCVIKPSHLSGEVIRRKEGEPLDLKRIVSWMDRDYYFQSRESNYRGLRPRVLVEPYLALDGNFDYKVFCFRGEPKGISVHRDQKGLDSRYRHSADWELLDRILNPKDKDAPESLPKPPFLGEILELSRILSRDFLAIRVDFLVAEGRVHLGELTNVSGGAGMRHADPVSWRAFNRVLFKEGGFSLRDFPELTV